MSAAGGPESLAEGDADRCPPAGPAAESDLPGAGSGAAKPASPRWTPFRQHLAAVVLLAGLTAVAYGNARPDAVVHDDRFFFPYNRSLGWDDVLRSFQQDTWADSGVASGVYRPLLLASIALDHALYGSQPAGYHTTNVVLHGAATVLLYLLLHALLAAGGRDERTVRERAAVVAAACAAAAVFCVHPIHTEAVNSIFNRSELLATLCVVSALWVLLRWSRSRPLAAWGAVSAIYLAGLLCRESAATLPLLAVLVLWLCGPAGTRRERLRGLAPVLMLAVPLLLYLLLRANALGGAPSAAAGAAAGAWGDRLAQTATMMLESLRMLVWPHPLRATYQDFVPSNVALAVAVHLALAGAFIWGLRRRRPAVAAGLGFFYLALLPSTRLFTDPSISVAVAERYVYLPSVGLALPLAVGFLALARRTYWDAAAAVGLVACVALVPATRDRNADWHGDVALSEAEWANAPGADALRLLTSALTEAGRSERAAALCDERLDAYSGHAKLANHCGTAYATVGREADAERAYRKALAAGGIDAVAHANLGRLHLRTGRWGDAQLALRQAVQAENDPARRRFRQGQLLLWLYPGDPERLAEAQAELEAALRMQPGSRPYREWLRRAREARGLPADP
ncbi:MAG: hypothetical protein JXB32_10365 [Deltaproteobacteria bacterium]|nr:hypothetical protein [Deltaproteobacteria bacterium]